MSVTWNATLFAGLAMARPADGAIVTVEVGGNGSVELGSTTRIVPKLNGKRVSMALAVNGILGGNATFGTIDEQTGQFVAPLVLPPGGAVTLTATTKSEPKRSGSVELTFRLPGPMAAAAIPATTPPVASMAHDARQPAGPAHAAATHLLEQATFGPTGAEIARLRRMGTTAWLQEQFSLPASPVPVDGDQGAVRRHWHLNMANGQDQLRQRMIFALSGIFAGPADENAGGNAIGPWLASLSNNAFGNYKTLLREMILHAAARGGLDDGDTYGRRVMQSFTVGPVMLNQDGTVRLDRNGVPLSTDDETIIHDMARALSASTCPDKDLDAVLDTLFKHPNVPPFIATRLIRHFVTGNPGPGYVRRVAEAFAFGAGARGDRGDLKATLLALLTDPEARYDGRTPNNGHMKDPIRHALALVRALDGAATDSD